MKKDREYHPAYGYLTKEEFEQAKNAGAGEAAKLKRIAEKRQRAAHRKNK